MESSVVAKVSQTSMFKVRKGEGWLFLQPGTVALGGLVWWGRNSGEGVIISSLYTEVSGENYWVRESCRISSEKSQWDERASFIDVHHAKPHCGKSHPQKVPVWWGRAKMVLSLSPSSLTKPVSSHPPGILHPQCLSTTSLPSMQWGTVTTAQLPSHSAFTTWQPATSTSRATCYGAMNTGTWLTNWQERTKVCWSVQLAAHGPWWIQPALKGLSFSWWPSLSVGLIFKARWGKRGWDQGRLSDQFLWREWKYLELSTPLKLKVTWIMMYCQVIFQIFTQW